MRTNYEIRFNRGNAVSTLEVVNMVGLKAKSYGFTDDYGWIKVRANDKEVEELKTKLNKYVGKVKE